MLFVIEILGEPDGQGVPRVIERRAHTAPTIAEAVRSARANMYSLPRGADSFSMAVDGKEVARWRRDSDGDGAAVPNDRIVRETKSARRLPNSQI